MPSHEEVFAKVTATDEWDQELKRNLSVPTFMRQTEMLAFLKEYYKDLHETLRSRLCEVNAPAAQADASNEAVLFRMISK